ADPVAEPLAQLMTQYRMPAVCDIMDWAESMGGLMTYGPDFQWVFQRAAEMVDKIMGGAKPSDMPIEQPDRYGLSLNLAIAQSIGLTFPNQTVQQAVKLFYTPSPARPQ